MRDNDLACRMEAAARYSIINEGKMLTESVKQRYVENFKKLRNEADDLVKTYPLRLENSRMVDMMELERTIKTEIKKAAVLGKNYIFVEHAELEKSLKDKFPELFDILTEAGFKVEQGFDADKVSWIFDQ